jgi:hypothetical protein
MMAFFAAGIARWFVLGGVVAVVFGGVYLKGHNDGYNVAVNKQQAQMAKMEKYVKDIRSRVERKLPPDDVNDIMRPDSFEREP